MAEVRAKVAAMSALSGERVDWGHNRAWERDYLANVSPYTPHIHCSVLLGSCLHTWLL